MKSYEFYIQTERKHIDFINKVIEAFEGIGIVRTLDPKRGIIKIISIDIYKGLIEELVKDLDDNNTYAKIIKQGYWEGEL